MLTFLYKHRGFPIPSKNIIILGGGISGLSCAFFLKKQGFNVTLLEKSCRCGGWIQTQHKEGFLFELGPRSFRSSGKGKATLGLIYELNLQNFLIKAKAKKRYLYLHQRLTPFSLSLLFKCKFFQTCYREWKCPLSSLEDETIGDFFRRRFNDEITETFIDPLVHGIFGGDKNTLSVRSCFPQFYQWEKNYGSLLKGMLREREPSTLFSLAEGMELLPKTLAEKLKEHIIYRTDAKRIYREKEKICVETTEKVYTADHLIAAIPSFALPPLVPEFCDHKLPFLSLTCVHIGFKNLTWEKKGFGYLVPSKEKEEILGMTWDSKIFPQKHNLPTFCVMLKGIFNEASALELTKRALSKHLNIQQDPTIVHVHVTKQAIPQYPIGHYASFQDLPNISLLGNSYHGVGINDCVAQAKSLSQKLAKCL